MAVAVFESRGIEPIVSKIKTKKFRAGICERVLTSSFFFTTGYGYFICRISKHVVIGVVVQVMLEVKTAVCSMASTLLLTMAKYALFVHLFFLFSSIDFYFYL